MTRAYHRTSRPSEFAALLQQFVRLPQALGLAVELPTEGAQAVVTTQAAATGAAGAAGGSSGAGGVEDSESGGAAADASEQPALNLQGVQSPLLRQLLGAAADFSVAAAAHEMLGNLNLEAAEKNDKINVLK